MKTNLRVMKGVLLTLSLVLVMGCANESMEPSEQLQSTAVKASQEGKLNFTTSLKGGNEVPASASKAAGHASIKISKDGTSIQFKVTAANLENVTAAHLHMAPAGSNGGVVAFLFSNPNPQPSGPQNGVLSEGVITEADVIGALAGDLAALIEAIQDGNIYVNVHTTAHPSGELRGQL